MHLTALNNAKRFVEKRVKPKMRVLDIGSMDINGTLKPLFKNNTYLGLDLMPGNNVDAVYNGKIIPFNDNYFDIAVSSSCFEHDPAFWDTFKEIVRVVRKGGYIYLNAPSAGGYHAYPIDCWRFMDDSWQALADYAGVVLVESYIDQTPPLHDSVGVFCV